MTGTTSKISTTEGLGKNIGTYEITESGNLVELQRAVPSDSAGVEKGTVANPMVDKSIISQDTPGTTDSVSVAGSTGSGTKNNIKDDTAWGDGVVAGILSVVNRLYNGTSYDRPRSAGPIGFAGVTPFAAPASYVSGVTAAMTGTTSTSLLAAPTTGLRNYITQLLVTNSHATVGTFVSIQDGNGGTTIYEGYAAPLGGGFSISFPIPLKQPTLATALYCADVTTGANVIVSASGFTGA